MDNSGCFNFGLGNSHLRGIALDAKIVIVEVNENLPLCLGGSDEYLHIDEIDYIIEGSNSPVFALPPFLKPHLKKKRLLN
jgi:acyl-CoA hydrolase